MKKFSNFFELLEDEETTKAQKGYYPSGIGTDYVLLLEQSSNISSIGYVLSVEHKDN